MGDAPPPTLRTMKGRLETIETAWMMAMQPSKRREIDQEFKDLAEEIKSKFGEEGSMVVNEVLAKHKGLSFSRA